MRMSAFVLAFMVTLLGSVLVSAQQQGVIILTPIGREGKVVKLQELPAHPDPTLAPCGPFFLFRVPDPTVYPYGMIVFASAHTSTGNPKSLLVPQNIEPYKLEIHVWGDARHNTQKHRPN